MKFIPLLLATLFAIASPAFAQNVEHAPTVEKVLALRHVTYFHYHADCNYRIDDPMSQHSCSSTKSAALVHDLERQFQSLLRAKSPYLLEDASSEAPELLFELEYNYGVGGDRIRLTVLRSSDNHVEWREIRGVHVLSEDLRWMVMHYMSPKDFNLPEGGPNPPCDFSKLVSGCTVE